LKTTPISTTVAIVGGASLLGRELQDLIRDEKLRWNLRLLSGEVEGSGTLAATGEEATYLEPLTAEALQDSAVVFLAGNLETSLKARELRPDALFIDLTGTLQTGGAKLAAPRIGVDPESKVLRIAHPAAIGLAFLLSKIPQSEQIVATVFEPASERGHSGIGELQKQSSNLLSFQPLPKDVFDAQVAFNLLAEFGEDAPTQLSAIEDRIDQDLRALSPKGEIVSLRLMQAPVFHAYGVLAWVRTSSGVVVEGLLQNDPLIDLRTAGTEGPSNSGAAQQDGFLIGSIRNDRRVPNAWWIWMTFDNLRVNASNALAAARQVL
jgi:aspartate-semialdehyde dehydrogenase